MVKNFHTTKPHSDRYSATFDADSNHRIIDVDDLLLLLGMLLLDMIIIVF